jgi:hypothetical protein
LNQSPILKALSSIRTSGAKTLLMGGQACIFYGAAEFSRDLDLFVLAEPENLHRLIFAMEALEAQVIAVPHFDPALLEKGHAVHFRCQRADVQGLRIDIMSRLREGDAFSALWERRSTVLVEDCEIDILSVADLVLAKKTQRDKDWPMIRRLLERSYYDLPEQPSREQTAFLLGELLSPELLVALANRFPDQAAAISLSRPALSHALRQDLQAVTLALAAEQAAEREKDRLYWAPLKQELEALRQSRPPKPVS